MTHRSALVQGISEIKSEIAGSSEDLILKGEVLINSKKESRENFQERKRGILGYRRGIGGIKREEGIFPTQGLNQSLLCFLHFRWALYCSGTWKVLESGHWEPRERDRMMAEAEPKTRKRRKRNPRLWEPFYLSLIISLYQLILKSYFA